MTERWRPGRPSRPVFIVGAERSGTTLLRLMLNEHPDLMIPRETWFLIQLLDELPNSGELSQEQLRRAIAICADHPRWPDLDISNSELRRASGNLASPTLANFIESIYVILQKRSGKTRWGDKTPGFVLEIDRLQRLFSGAQFIHIIRDARAVSLSLLEKKWFGTHLRNAAGRWTQCVQTGMALGRELPPGHYLEVKFEDLVRNGEIELQRICEFLGIEYSSVMLDYHQYAAENIAPWQRIHHGKTLDPLRVGEIDAWRARATLYRLVVIEGIAGKTMDMAQQMRDLTGWRSAFTAIARVVEWTFVRVLGARRGLLRFRKTIWNKLAGET